MSQPPARVVAPSSGAYRPSISASPTVAPTQVVSTAGLARPAATRTVQHTENTAASTIRPAPLAAHVVSPAAAAAAAAGAGRALVVSSATPVPKAAQPQHARLAGTVAPMSQSTFMAQQPVTLQGAGLAPQPAAVQPVVPAGVQPQQPMGVTVVGTRTATTSTVTQQMPASLQPRVIKPMPAGGMQASTALQTQFPDGGRALSQGTVQVETRPHTFAGPGLTQGAYEAKHQDDPQLANLKDLRKSSGLKSVPVADGMQFLRLCSADGKLTREQFINGYEQLLTRHNVEVPPDMVKNAVFDLFDRDDNNVVDMMELICGISLLCAGGEDDKIHAVFDLFDENKDGFISMDEMFKFLTSVFNVVLTPNVMGVMNSMGVTIESAEDLASVTALECFKTADLNHDGKLSVSEFKNWFYAPRNDPSFLFSPVRKVLS